MVRDSEGDHTFAGFGDYDTTEFADPRLQAKQLPVALFEEAAFLVLGTLSLAYPDTREAITLALNLAQNNGVKIFVDVNWRENFWPDPSMADQSVQELVQQADFLKLNDQEAEKLFGIADPKAIAQRLNKASSQLFHI